MFIQIILLRLADGQAYLISTNGSSVPTNKNREGVVLRMTIIKYTLLGNPISFRQLSEWKDPIKN
jgi:hypothetical protein